MKTAINAIAATLCLALASTASNARGPYGSINVGNWHGGAYTNDKNGSFSHCAAGATYQSGIYFVVSVGEDYSWRLGFAHENWQLTAGQSFALALTFDGQPAINVQVPIGSHLVKSASAPPKPSKTVKQTGTGFVISANGHVVTNQHVIEGCVGDIQGNLSGESPVKLRVVSSDETNDLALLQARTSFKEIASIRSKPIHPGDSVVAIGYPFHGLLTSDFTVTTGVVNSLSGVLNDTRFLQISAPVQPGNSGGPLLDSNGEVVGMVAAKLNALKFVKATGDMPENINFAIKTGALRDFLDNSVVAYQTIEAKSELKTSDIARNARSFTLLIACMATEQSTTAKKSDN